VKWERLTSLIASSFGSTKRYFFRFKLQLEMGKLIPIDLFSHKNHQKTTGQGGRDSVDLVFFERSADSALLISAA
jgi:hypothetical protein